MPDPQPTPRQYLPRQLNDFEERIRKLERRVVAASGGARCTVSDTAPTTPPPVLGDLWFQSSTGFMFVYITSPSAVWVQV